MYNASGQCVIKIFIYDKCETQEEKFKQLILMTLQGVNGRQNKQFPFCFDNQISLNKVLVIISRNLLFFPKDLKLHVFVLFLMRGF